MITGWIVVDRLVLTMCIGDTGIVKHNITIYVLFNINVTSIEFEIIEMPY